MFNAITSPSKSNPHARLGPYAEGDFQSLRFQTEGDIWAATVDDLSGKICLVVEGSEQIQIVVLDYGWDFWNPAANEEMTMKRGGMEVEPGGTPDSEDLPPIQQPRSMSL